MTRREVHVHIERLVFDGFPGGTLGSAARVADGISRELERLVAGQLPQAWKKSGETSAAQGPPVGMPLGAPERLGERIAASIHRAVPARSRR
ncbi:MAG: hypothetical protein ACM3PC_13325 [Deltaproteobacteria bacterium]